MQEKDRESIALFRYGLIAPILNQQVSSKKEYLAEICSLVHQVPYYGTKQYNPKTVEEWIRTYQREGFDGLKPKQRADRGKSRIIPPEQQEPVLALRQQHRDMPVTLFYETLIKKGIIMRREFSYSTVYRFLKKHDLLGKQERKEPERKRFAYDKVNMLWQVDCWHGPYVKVNGKKAQTFLLAFIDDCSRVIPAARFSLTEKSEDLMRVFEEALLRRGIPRMVYADNGKIFRSDQFHLACASLGITLAHTRPYDAAAKGKIERFFGNVSQRFLPLFYQQEISTLEGLNQFFGQWLEQDYHRKVHSALKMSPLDKYLSQASSVKMVEDPEALRLLFLKREQRKVRHDGTISLQGNLFEVPPEFTGQRIEVRFDEDLKEVYLFCEGKKITEAKPVNMTDNARVKRDNPALSFKDWEKGGDE